MPALRAVERASGEFVSRPAQTVRPGQHRLTNSAEHGCFFEGREHSAFGDKKHGTI